MSYRQQPQYNNTDPPREKQGFSWERAFGCVDFTCGAGAGMRLDEWMAVFGPDDSNDDIQVPITSRGMNQQSAGGYHQQQVGVHPHHQESKMEDSFVNEHCNNQYDDQRQSPDREVDNLSPAILSVVWNVEEEKQSEYGSSVENDSAYLDNDDRAIQEKVSLQLEVQECDPTVCLLHHTYCVDCCRCAQHCTCGRSDEEAAIQSLAMTEEPPMCDPSTCRQLICGDCSRCTQHCVCNWDQPQCTIIPPQNTSTPRNMDERPLYNKNKQSPLEEAYFLGLQKKEAMVDVAYGI